MSKFIPVAKTSDIQPGEMKTFTIQGKGILIANVAGAFFATQDLCTHDGGSLKGGTLAHSEIECPRHGARFDVKTGAVRALPAVRPIQTFPIKIEDDTIFITLG